MSRRHTLTSFAEIEEVLKSPDFVRLDPDVPNGPLRLHTVQFIEGAAHRDRRRIESVLFKRGQLASYDREILTPAIARALAHRAARRDGDGHVRADLVELVPRVVMPVFASLAGIDGADDDGAADELAGMAVILTAASDVLVASEQHTRAMERALPVKARFAEKYFRPSWERRRALVDRMRAGELAASELPTDLITLMLLHGTHYDAWQDDDLYLRETIVYALGAVLSLTGATLQSIHELETWLRAHPGDRGGLVDADWLRDAIIETLRIHQHGIPKQRRAIRDTELSSGRHVDAGDRVLLYTGAAGRDPAVYGDRAAFQIPRSIPRNDPYGLVFGAGEHACIGRSLAVGEPSTSRDAPIGVIVTVLRELYAAGMRIDPDRPPVPVDDPDVDAYLSFVVVLDRV